MYKGMTINQMQNLCRNTRKTEHHDWDGMVHSPPLLHTSTNMVLHNFLLFDTKIYISTNECTRIIGWAHYELIHLVKLGPKHFYVDCTFSCVPDPFSQLLIIMMYVQASDIYIPVFYILLQSKLEVVYKAAIYHCQSHTNFLMEAASITCDFEIGLINALQFHFRDSDIIGCEFHWKQAIRRKLLSFKIPADIISRLVDKNGLLNILTEIPVTEIGKGIAYIRATFDEGQYIEEFNNFWKYFTKTWMNTYDPKVWNVHRFIVSQNTTNKPSKILINRTNNPLERFNLTLGTSFSKFGHPRMPDFVTTIKLLSEKYYADYNLIQAKQLVGNAHKPFTVHGVPDAYYAFVHNTGSDSSVSIGGQSMISNYSYLVDSIHFDTDRDEMGYYRVTELGYVVSNGKQVLVGYRQEVPCAEFPMKGSNLVEDYITVDEIMSFIRNNSNGTTRTSNTKKRRT